MNYKSKPLITTIIPTYRRPKLLKRAIKSVLNQTYPHFQVCVYDNDSGDETASIVNEMAKKDSRIRYHCHSENIGGGENFQYGLSHIDTKFFSILSDDDVLLPDFYAIAIKGFEKYKEAGFVSTNVLNADSWGNVFFDHGSMHKAGFYSPFDGLLSMLLKSPPTWTGILFKKSVIDRIGFLDKEVGACSDADFVLRAAAKFSFAHYSHPGAIFIPESISKTNSLRGNIEETWPGWLKMIRNLVEDDNMSLNVRAQVEYLLRKKLKNRLLTIGIVAILRGDFADSYKTAEILRCYCHQKTKGTFLYIIAKTCDHIALVRYLFLWLNYIRFQILRVKRSFSGKNYSRYKTMLKL